MDIKGTGYAFFRGFYDSFRGMIILFYLDKEMNDRMARLSPTKSAVPVRRKPSGDSRESTPVRKLKEHEESKVLKRTIQCCILNGGIFLLSIFLFEHGLLPGLNKLLYLVFGEESSMRKFVWSWIKPLLSFVFRTIWVLPLFLLSKVVNSLWFQDIADSAFKYTRGRPTFMQNISKLISDSVFSILVQALFLVQAMLVNYVPIYMLGYILSLIHMCLLYSLYAFEYKWFNMGWELHKRLAFIESNWPYFIGFGLPLAVLTQLSESWIISGCIFSILFPLFIISGNGANPVTGVCDYPLHLFSPVIAMSNAILDTTIKSTPKTQIPVNRNQTQR